MACDLYEKKQYTVFVLKKKILKQTNKKKKPSLNSFELTEISKHYFLNLYSLGSIFYYIYAKT